MKILKCESCGSPLNIKDENAQYVTCEYCDTKYKLNEKSQIEFKIDDNAKEILQESGKFFKFFTVGSSIATIFVVGFILLIAFLIGSSAYKQMTTPNEAEITIFNSNYESRSGTQYTMFVKYLLDDVVTNNKKNKDKLITVTYNDIKTSDTKEIKNLKSKLTASKYEIELDYSSIGYVDSITIEDIE